MERDEERPARLAVAALLLWALSPVIRYAFLCGKDQARVFRFRLVSTAAVEIQCRRVIECAGIHRCHRTEFPEIGRWCWNIGGMEARIHSRQRDGIGIPV